MNPRLIGSLALAGGLVLLLCPAADAQMLYGMDGGGGLVWEVPLLAGPPCGQPTNPAIPWPYAGAVFPCPVPPPLLTPVLPPPAGIVGDVATDRLTDIVYVTDGITIGEFAGGSPIAAPAGTPLNSYLVPPALGMGPITGMGMDGTGTLTAGAPTLWITDGALVAGIGPGAPGCGPAVILAAPFPHGLPVPPGGLLTDITWDPTTGSFWVCDTAGFIYNMGPAGGLVGPVFPVVGCGLALPLQGIAFDLASPGFPFIGAALAPAVYVTDGAIIQYMDVVAGALAGPTFYTSIPCSPTPVPLNGLAYATKGLTYGAPSPPFTLGIGSFGQASSPGPTFGLFYTGAAATSAMFVAFGANALAPGYFCPPIPLALGGTLWVDAVTPPGGVVFLGPAVPGLGVLPAPLPAGLPPGIGIFVQFFEDTSGVGVGPFISSDAVSFFIGAP